MQYLHHSEKNGIVAIKHGRCKNYDTCLKMFVIFKIIRVVVIKYFEWLKINSKHTCTKIFLTERSCQTNFVDTSQFKDNSERRH